MKYSIKDFLMEKTIPWMPKPKAYPRWQQALVVILLSLIFTQSVNAGLILGLVLIISWYFWVKKKKGG